MILVWRFNRDAGKADFIGTKQQLVEYIGQRVTFGRFRILQQFKSERLNREAVRSAAVLLCSADDINSVLAKLEMTRKRKELRDISRARKEERLGVIGAEFEKFKREKAAAAQASIRRLEKAFESAKAPTADNGVLEIEKMFKQWKVANGRSTVGA